MSALAIHAHPLQDAWARARSITFDLLATASELVSYQWAAQRAHRIEYWFASRPNWVVVPEATSPGMWPREADRPVNWWRSLLTLPERKLVLAQQFPNSVFVKSNEDGTRHLVAPMAAFLDAERKQYRNSLSRYTDSNHFRLLDDASQVTSCDDEELPLVVLRELLTLSTPRRGVL